MPVTLVMLLGWLLFKQRVTGRQLLALAISDAVYLAFSADEVRRLGALRLTSLATTVACLLCIG